MENISDIVIIRVPKYLGRENTLSSNICFEFSFPLYIYIHNCRHNRRTGIRLQPESKCRGAIQRLIYILSYSISELYCEAFVLNLLRLQHSHNNSWFPKISLLTIHSTHENLSP